MGTSEKSRAKDNDGAVAMITLFRLEPGTAPPPRNLPGAHVHLTAEREQKTQAGSHTHAGRSLKDQVSMNLNSKDTDF